MEKKLSILLTGYIGNNNLGDDLMMMETLRFFQEECPEAELTVFLRYQGCKRRQIYGRNVRIINLHPFRIGRIKERLYGFFVAARYDLVLWVGGTCFADIGGDGLYSYFRYNIKAGVPFGYLGVGIDYFENRGKRARARELFVKGELTVFRDRVSLEQAERLLDRPDSGQGRLFLAEDIVYRVLDRVKLDIPKRKRLLVSWRYQSQYMGADEEAKRMKILEDTIAEMADSYAEVVFLPIDEHMDGAVNRKLAGRMKARFRRRGFRGRIRMAGHMDALDKLEFIAGSEAYICGRLHGIMIGELAGCNVAALDYSLKVQIFMNSIGRQCDDVPVGEMTKERLLAALSCGVMEDRERIRLEKKKEADKNFEYLAKVTDKLKCRKKTETGN